MAKRPLTAAQLQHNRDIARKGGLAAKAKYGGWHFAHVARSARAHGTYVAPTVKSPFASLKTKQATARLTPTTTPLKTSRGITQQNLTAARKTSVKSTTSLPSSVFTRSSFQGATKRTIRRKPAVR